MVKTMGFDGISENMVAYATMVNGIQWNAPHIQRNEKCWNDAGIRKNHVYRM